VEARISDLITVLERTPGVLRAMLAGTPDELIRGTEGGESWSPFDVVGHLIHGERTDWIPRLTIILAESDTRPFEPFDRYAQFEASDGKTLDELLDEFEILRDANLGTLRALLDTGFDLESVGTHPELGQVTAGELLATWAVHDLGHIAQIARVMAKQFSDETGPWRAYLPVLRGS
jgi:hypothetical protein